MSRQVRVRLRCTFMMQIHAYRAQYWTVRGYFHIPEASTLWQMNIEDYACLQCWTSPATPTGLTDTYERAHANLGVTYGSSRSIRVRVRNLIVPDMHRIRTVGGQQAQHKDLLMNLLANKPLFMCQINPIFHHFLQYGIALTDTLMHILYCTEPYRTVVANPPHP